MDRNQMIEDIEALETELRATPFAGQPVAKLWVDALASAFVIDLDAVPTDEDWATFGSFAKGLGRYAVLTTWNDISFDEERPWKERGPTFVQQAIADSLEVDVAHFQAMGGQRASYSATQQCDWPSWLDMPTDHDSHPLQQVLRRFGESPSVQQLRDLHAQGRHCSDAAFERWMLDWELQRFGPAALAPGPVHHLERHELSHWGPSVALLLPTTESWKAFLHLGWYGAYSQPAEQAAVMRHWQSTYGAELTGAFGVTIHMRTQRRPQIIDEAFALAVEHDNFASSTLGLSSVSLRDHARALLTADHWKHYEKP